MSESKPWLNGRPYYCKLCGCGGPEYVACEEGDCELESEAEALARLPTVRVTHCGNETSFLDATIKDLP